ncbi:MAG: hypothetical protein ACWA6X_10620 [Bauldia sp.]
MDGEVKADREQKARHRRDTPIAVHRTTRTVEHTPAGARAWEVNFTQANQLPIMATATDLLFMGGNDAGEMRALDATNGETVWSFRTGSRFNQSPITYLGPDGRQYVAIIASSAATNTAVAVNAAADDANRYRRSGSTLYVFALPNTVAAQ